MKFPSFCGPTYTSLSPNVDAEWSMNWFVEQTESDGAKVQRWLASAPGFQRFTTLPEYPNRGLLTQNGRTFAANGAGVYELSANRSYTRLGTVTQDSNPATLSTNGPAGHQVFITSGRAGYIFDLVSGGFSTIANLVVDQGAFVDGYFLGLNTQTATLQISALEDGLTWNLGDVAQRNTAGDKWQALLVAHRDVWLFGSQRTDVWRNTGNAAFPFQPIDGADLNQGILAPFSAVVLDNAPVWLGGNENGPGVVWQANGYVPTRISTHAVEIAIQRYARIDDAVAWSYEENGHSFYVLTFPSARATWVYDAATQLWHERGLWQPNVGSFNAYRPQTHAFAFGTHLVGDRESGTIFEMSQQWSADVDGAALRRVRRSPYIQKDDNYRARHVSFEADFEVGLGATTGQGARPLAMLRWSDDQAKTWSTERDWTTGDLGQYQTRVRWLNLGMARNRIYELSYSEPLPAKLAQAWLVVK